MHASYFFLVDFPEGKPSDPKEIRQVFADRYGSEYCDENNWYQEEFFLWNDGTVIQLAEDGDWRERDNAYHEWSEIPEENRWTKMLELAWRVTAYDLSINDVSSFGLIWGTKEQKLDELPIEELKRLVIHQPAETLAKKYADLAERLKAGVFPNYDTGTFLSDYERGKTSSVYERFLAGMRESPDQLPFLMCVNPYEGSRVISLVTDSEETKDHGIIVVDIHT